MITTYFAKLISEDIFKHQYDQKIPITYYIGLSSTLPTINGENVIEPDENTGYMRIAVDNDEGIFGKADETGIVSNISKLYFSESKAAWDGITHFVVFDAPTDGNLLIFGALNKTMNIPMKTIVSIPAGTLKIKTQV